MNMHTSTSLARQQWLENAVSALRSRFTDAGYTVPDAVRVSIGWPKGGGVGHKIGQCFSLSASSDAHHEIFISPELGGELSSVRIIGVLAHELAHATVGIDAKHGKVFKRAALAVGLEGKMTATTESGEFVAWCTNDVIGQFGLYPAGALTGIERKKQSTRLLKCECDTCGYVARVTAKWVKASGAPVCPTDQVAMACDMPDDDDDGESDE